jgi:type II secretory pathway component PulK
MNLQLRKHRGAVLVIALVLLLIVTLLATTGMAMSITEFVMAGNEQFHRKAIDAASAGVETVIARLVTSPPEQRASVSASGATAAGEFIASVKDVGAESNLTGFSSEKFIGRHFDINSEGASVRNASDAQIQGVLVIEAVAGTSTFTRIGDGLAAGGRGP